MFTKKDRKIANLTAMVENRDSIIEQLKERKDIYKNTAEYQREELARRDAFIKRIENLLSANKYNNEKAVLEKIKELVDDYQSIN